MANANLQLAVVIGVRYSAARKQVAWRVFKTKVFSSILKNALAF
jgi:hypothetical protein